MKSTPWIVCLAAAWLTQCKTVSAPNSGVLDAASSGPALTELGATVPAAAAGQDRTTVVIVGAGLSGMTAAYELRKAGIDTIVLEAADRIGGRVHTVGFPDGTTAEAHMEEYWQRSPAYALLQELGLPLADDVAHSSIRIDGKIYPYTGEGDRDTYLGGIFTPEETAAWKAWSAKSWQLYQRLHASHYSGQPLPADLKALMQTSFAAFVAADHLPRKVSEWIRATIEPEMAIEWDQISALDGIDESRLFLDTDQGFGEMNYHVKGGNYHFIDALLTKLKPGSVRSSAFVTDVAQTASGVTVTYKTKDGGTGTVNAKYAVVTVPLFAIDKIHFNPPLSATKQKAIATTGFGHYVKVHFLVDAGAQETWAKYGDVFTLLSDSNAGSIYNATGFEDLKPGQDMVMTLLMHARFTEPYLNQPDAVVEKRAAAAMDELFPGFSSHIKASYIYLYPTAVAYWPLAKGRSRFDELADDLRRPEGRIYIGGDTTDDSHSEGAIQAALRMSGMVVKAEAASAPQP